MEIALIILIGFLFSCGLYLILRRSVIRLLIGILFLGQAGNLAILVVPGLGSGRSSIIGSTETVLSPGYADPLPQALILTAIVIGFGVIAYAIVLIKKTATSLNSDDLDDYTHTDA